MYKHRKNFIISFISSVLLSVLGTLKVVSTFTVVRNDFFLEDI